MDMACLVFLEGRCGLPRDGVGRDYRKRYENAFPVITHLAAISALYTVLTAIDLQRRLAERSENRTSLSLSGEL